MTNLQATSPPLQQQTQFAIINANIRTFNQDQPTAQAMLCQADTIKIIGTNADVLQHVDSQTVKIDAHGRLVLPGFIDSHVHFLEGGHRLASVQLRNAKTPEEFIARIYEYAQTLEPGAWITGGDWDHENWDGTLPNRSWIDSVTADNPVWINRLDGHMALANSTALALAGITKQSADIEGGTIVRDVSGKPTGILKDNAMSLIDPFVPQPTDPQQLRALQAAMDYVASCGVTSVHHFGTWDELDIFEQARNKHMLRTRLYAGVPLQTYARLQQKISRAGNGDVWLRIGCLKGFVDGSLGSHTAAMLEPYTDAPQDSGLLVESPDSLFKRIDMADQAGLQVIVHAIGDRANRTLLDIYERVLHQNGARDRRFRIEHAQHIHPDDYPRFQKYGVIASMQPYHLIDDGRWAEKVIGHERCRYSYAYRTLLDIGARLVFGSDWYVAPPTPLDGIYAAVTRRTLDNRHPGGWIPEQKISVEEAIRAYTIDAAYASFEENIKGSLVPGKLADFVMLDRDLFRTPPEAIRDARILLTVVGGTIVYQDAKSE
ncbi:amidohydrolase [candidate division KSB1 bacterium]|nr:amidohydrolase [candidate division KSB1 bacterium]